MIQEVILVTSAKEGGGGMVCLDVHLASTAPVCSFKTCIADPHCLAVVSGASSFSGQSSAGDYIVASQAKKPVLHVYQWGKPQPHQQCHIQEITTALACDSSGTFLFGGTKKGWIYCWDLPSGALLASWQAHFKAVTRIAFSSCGQLAASVSEDGMARCWEVASIVQMDAPLSSSSGSGGKGGSSKGGYTPFRSWSPHTLAVKDMLICGTASSALRVLTCSIDRTFVIFDVHSNRQCFRAALPSPLESLALNRTEDMALLGSTGGQIFILDLSLAASGMTSAHAQVVVGADAQSRALGGAAGSAFFSSNINTNMSSSSSSGSGSSSGSSCTKPYTILEGHTRAVTSLACSLDNCTVVSGSEDGSVRVWDMWTRQCLRESKPLHKAAISSILLLRRPEALHPGPSKPALAPLEHIKKYANSSSSGGDASASVGSSASSSASAKNSSSSGGQGGKLVLSARYLGGVDASTNSSDSAASSSGSRSCGSRAGGADFRVLARFTGKRSGGTGGSSGETDALEAANNALSGSGDNASMNFNNSSGGGSSSGSSISSGVRGGGGLPADEDFLAFTASELDAWPESTNPNNSNKNANSNTNANSNADGDSDGDGNGGGNAEALLSRIAALESDCERWRRVAVGLKRRIDGEGEGEGEGEGDTSMMMVAPASFSSAPQTQQGKDHSKVKGKVKGKGKGDGSDQSQSQGQGQGKKVKK